MLVQATISSSMAYNSGLQVTELSKLYSVSFQRNRGKGTQGNRYQLANHQV